MVGRLLRDHDIHAVLDLGCGEGSLLNFLVGDTEIERLVGVDLLEDRLKMAVHTLTPTEMDRLFERERPLSIDLYQGSICEPSSVPQQETSIQAMTCIEVYARIHSALVL